VTCGFSGGAVVVVVGGAVVVVVAVVGDVRFHDLRHGCASLLFDLGVPLRMVMEILGHSQISTTSGIYTHVMPAQYREVSEALDDCLAGGAEAGEGQADGL
jgi:integrase